ncbi:MAG: 50S ribosomal protein L23 [Bacilli bacterium]|nr:50S ribosomal protein L23 [Bacilli bacterium]MDD4584327.1 50S ribosomal protein L23 [Bacilli bacterium]
MARTKKVEEKATEVVTAKYPAATQFDYEIIKRPVVTEKSLKLMQTENKITVKVAKDANSTAIKKAFEAIFNKKVERVNIVNVRRKPKRVGRFDGFMGAYKKAIIKLAPGETLDLFEDKK